MEFQSHADGVTAIQSIPLSTLFVVSFEPPSERLAVCFTSAWPVSITSLTFLAIDLSHVVQTTQEIDPNDQFVDHYATKTSRGEPTLSRLVFFYGSDEAIRSQDKRPLIILSTRMRGSVFVSATLALLALVVSVAG
ncbi:hypothetical protein AC1031_020476 [Aphanomyces cochlioides]|nr:hypothetical protein AC1031_020476 [Aphanomyces cochlioides]